MCLETLRLEDNCKTMTIFINDIPLITMNTTNGYHSITHSLSEMKILVIYYLDYNKGIKDGYALISGKEKGKDYLLPIRGPLFISKKLKGNFKKYIKGNYVVKELQSSKV